MKRHKGVTKLATQKYRVRVRATDPRTGTEKELKRVVRGTLEEALAIQRQMADELANDRPRQRLKLAEYGEVWLDHRLETVKPSTAAKYVNDLRLHILPALGRLYVDSIRPADVKAFVARQLQAYAGWTVANRLRLLRILAKDALADGLTALDFCARVRLPRVAQYTEDEPNLLTADQFQRVAQAVPTAWYPLFATMAFTGLRWGEVSGLQWSDIDWRGGLIRVRRSNWKGRITTPKTEGSLRTVPMGEQLAGILQGHQARLEARAHPCLVTGWVFSNARGGLHKGTPMRTVLQKAVARAGLTIRLTPHGLRRTFNDLARRVASSVVVRAIVGHVTEKMTEHYAVIDAGEKRAVQDAVLRLVEGRSEEKNSLQREHFREHRAPEDPPEPDET